MNKYIQNQYGFFLLALLQIFALQVNAADDEIYFKPLSHITFIEKQGKTLVAGANLQLTLLNFKTVLNIDEKFFLFGTYNFDRKKTFWTDENTKLDNSGFSIGGGIKLKKKNDLLYEYLILGGIEQQKINFTRIYINPSYKDQDVLETKFLNPFAQINISITMIDYQVILSTRFSLLYFNKYEYIPYSYSGNVSRYFEKKALPLLEPALSFAFRDLPLDNLTLNTQVGLSLSLLKIKRKASEYSMGRAIFMIGFEYSFGLGSNASK
jgi:hypothetical protein